MTNHEPKHPPADMDEFVEFPMSNDKTAQDRAYWYRQGKDDGIEQERGNIVEWLRKLSGYDSTTPTFQDRRLAHQLAALDFSNCIEAGEHLK